MRIVYAPVDMSRYNHLAQPGALSTNVSLGWGVELETDEERELLSYTYLPFSATNQYAISLDEPRHQLETRRRRLIYNTLTTEQMREGLIGLEVSYLWYDYDVMGFDFRRGGPSSYGGVTFTYPRLSQLPGVPRSNGMITGVYDEGFVLSDEHLMPFPEGIRVNSLSEVHDQPLFWLG